MRLIGCSFATARGIRTLPALLLIFAGQSCFAQAGLSYSIVSDTTNAVIGQVGGDGISVATQGVSAYDAWLAQASDMSGAYSYKGPIWSMCADGSVIAEACPNGAGSLIGVAGSDIAVAGNSLVYFLANEGPTPDDKYILRLGEFEISPGVTAKGMDRMPSNAVRIATANGIPWIVNSAGNIFRWNGSRWEQMPGLAQDIAGNAAGVVWILDRENTPCRWDPATNSWQKGSGGGASIAVDPSGNPWVVNHGYQIWRWTGKEWQLLPGGATDIGIADDGTVYVIGGYGMVYKWPVGATAWVPMPSVVGTRVAAGPSGLVFARVPN